MKEGKTVTLHGKEWSLSDTEESANYWSKEYLKKEEYAARDALVDKAGGSSRPYSGKKFDKKHFKVVEKGWNHDHCEICFWRLHESKIEEEGVGYTDGYGNWICLECFEKLVKPRIRIEPVAGTDSAR